MHAAIIPLRLLLRAAILIATEERGWLGERIRDGYWRLVANGRGNPRGAMLATAGVGAVTATAVLGASKGMYVGNGVTLEETWEHDPKEAA